jgi:arylformamidase
MSQWIDISIPLSTGMIHWPGDPEPILERMSDIDRGDVANVTFLKMSAHTGTHLDAGIHFVPGTTTIDQFPLEAGIGPARVVEFGADVRAIGRKELAGCPIGNGERLLLKTRNSASRWFEQEFNRGAAFLAADGAAYLVSQGIRLVGIDSLSIGAYEGDGAETHRILLKAGVWIAEGLDLCRVGGGEYDLIFLPLRLAGADGAPARALLRPRVAKAG